MNRQRLTDEFKQLVSIDSPSGQEREMADYLTKILTGLGAEVEEDDAGKRIGGNCGNLYAFLKGNLPGEPLLFSMHMDTVVPALHKKAVLHSDGRFTSDGTTVLGADDLAAVAEVLEVLRTIQEEEIPFRDLEFLFSVGEERHLLGSRYIDGTRLKSREAYVLDLSGRPGTAAVQAPTLAVFEARIQGKAAHAGFSPESGIHAVKTAAAATAGIEVGRVEEDTTVNVGSIQGGGPTNIVPDSCLVTGEVRSLSYEKVKKYLEKIRNQFEKEAKRTGAELDFHQEMLFCGYQTIENHPVVRRFERACKAVRIPCRLISTFGGSDQNHLTEHKIEGIVLASSMHRAHSCEEYAVLDEMMQVAELVKYLMTTVDEGEIE